MENHEDQLIFSQQFPDAEPMAILEKLSRTAPVEPTSLPPTFDGLLKLFEEKYTYKLKPEAEKEAKQFIAKAIAVCREFEIDTEICKRSYEIDVSMYLYCGWHDSAFKCAFISLLELADDFTLARDKSRPEYVCISLSYHTHDIYAYGKKKEWW